MTNIVQNNQPKVDTQSFCLRDRIQQNWNHRKVQLISSGTSTLALGSGVVAATLLGGPLSAIIALAAATFAALVVFIASLFEAPNTKTIAQPKQETVQQPVQLQQTEEVVQPATKQEEKKSLFDRTVSYVKAHPYQSAAIGAAALTAAGVGLYSVLGQTTAATKAALPQLPAPANETMKTFPLFLTSNVFAAQQQAVANGQLLGNLGICGTHLQGCQVAVPVAAPAVAAGASASCPMPATSPIKFGPVPTLIFSSIKNLYNRATALYNSPPSSNVTAPASYTFSPLPTLLLNSIKNVYNRVAALFTPTQSLPKAVSIEPSSINTAFLPKPRPFAPSTLLLPKTDPVSRFVISFVKNVAEQYRSTSTQPRLNFDFMEPRGGTLGRAV